VAQGFDPRLSAEVAVDAVRDSEDMEIQALFSILLDGESCPQKRTRIDQASLGMRLKVALLAAAYLLRIHGPAVWNRDSESRRTIQ
jgi:hypothetical protein